MGFWDWLMGTPPQQRAMPAKKRPARLSAAERTSVFHLRLGDIVSYDTVDYAVKNKISYDDEGYVWYDYLLVDAASGEELWLSAEDDDGVEIGLYREIDLDRTLPPVPSQLTVQGRTYRQVEHSDAQVQVERERVNRSQHSEIEYWEYKGGNGHYLTVSRWGGEYEVSEGRAIEEHELTIYPAQAQA